jgi:hypothetical protein
MTEGLYMSRISRSTRIDKNRYSKTYPYLHRVPSYSYVNNPAISYEIGEVCFAGNDAVTYTFAVPYRFIPSIVIAPIGDDINVWISSISEESVTFNASVNNNSCISFHIVDIGLE